MRKIFTFAALGFASVLGHTHSHVETPEVAAWPPLNLYTTFKADATLHTFDGKKLKPYKDISALTKVDGDRNKIKVDAKVAVPLLGKVSAEILIDTAAGTITEYIPILKICQSQPIPKTTHLKELLQKIYSEEGGLTTYDGDVKAAWDGVDYDKFHLTLAGEKGSATVHAYVDKNTHNGRWLQEVTTHAKDPKIIVNIPKGEEPATFTDADFTIKGCTKVSSERLVNIWA